MVALFRSHNRIAAKTGAQKFLIAGFFNSLFSIGTEGTAPAVVTTYDMAPRWLLMHTSRVRRT